ncbi:MAG: 2-keto-4-pentenoate hydratase/2-oxohepta-3-ene,7-dioic acid hydratase (Catechol pathway) [Acidimicrobiales bacterium]|nr:2-keto-4-pentenoate hydratase/2-oxohepta-3-ene,7-dioic acid hydratase (Catechol pathway) [Acidimicrobiales bacterium]
MRWVSYRTDPSGPERTGLVVGDKVHAMAAGVELANLLGDGGERLRQAADWATNQPAEARALAEVTVLAPFTRPPSIRDFYAFEQHVRTAREGRGLEMDPDWYELPVFYFTNPAAVIGTGEDVHIPLGSAALDFELEVAAVVGLAGSNLSPEEAEAHIAGYLVMNDWSARDLQAREMRQGLGPAKGKDFATTLGPALITPDELEPMRKGKAYDLPMVARVNGREYSRGNLADIHWSFGELLSYASRSTRVVPGDVIGSGTCGTGCILELSITHGTEAYPWLHPGDTVELEVAGLGTVTNRVVA